MRLELEQLIARVPSEPTERPVFFADMLDGFADSIAKDGSVENVSELSKKIVAYWISELKAHIEEVGREAFETAVENESHTPTDSTDLCALFNSEGFSLIRTSPHQDVDHIFIAYLSRPDKEMFIEGEHLSVQGKELEHRITLKHEKIVKWDVNGDVLYPATELISL